MGTSVTRCNAPVVLSKKQQTPRSLFLLFSEQIPRNTRLCSQNLGQSQSLHAIYKMNPLCQLSLVSLHSVRLGQNDEHTQNQEFFHRKAERPPSVGTAAKQSKVISLGTEVLGQCKLSTSYSISFPTNGIEFLMPLMLIPIFHQQVPCMFY